MTNQDKLNAAADGSGLLNAPWTSWGGQSASFGAIFTALRQDVHDIAAGSKPWQQPVPPVDPAVITKAVTDAVNAALPGLVDTAVKAAIAANPITVDLNAIAEAVEARLQAQLNK